MVNRIVASFVLAAAFTELAIAQPPPLDTARIEQATGMKGKYNATENVYKISKPRANLTAIDGWQIPPFLGVSSYASFTPAGPGRVMVMGDNVLLEEEVAPTMRAAIENGLEVTALHNHYFFDQPKIYFMHIDGMGETTTVATAVKKVLDTPDLIRSGQFTSHTKRATPMPAESHITGAPLESILGKKGETDNGMLKVSYGRAVKIHGITAGDAMGVNTWAGFAGTDDHAVVDGDFAVREDELQPVLKSLLQSAINIVAIHQHMTHEEPRIIFFHYWGEGKAQDLAKAVRAAVNLTSTKVP